MTSWGEIVAEAVTLRRALHARPELPWAEVETARTIRARLAALGIAWQAFADTGTVATLAPRAPGRHIALRADIDALPIHEATGAPWASEHDGKMHACGHDGHAATLLAAAQWLVQHERALPGPVTLVFQPAEEGGHGAKRMLEAGALEGVEAIYGWHNWPAIPRGQAVCPDGPVMSANGTFRILVSGAGGHASQPERCADPVLAAAAITLALQQIVSRRVAPQSAVVVAVTSIVAPSAETVTPHEAVLAGSIRLADDALRPSVDRWIAEIAEQTARAYGVRAEVESRPRYGATTNHPPEAEAMRAALAAELGPTWRSEIPAPIMASEDFSYYLAAIPGAFALVGSGKGEDDPPCHSPHYDFDDALIARVARVYVRLAGAPLPPLE
ncbi:MAG: N(2)-acetyl-L-2,4-diaminobutanoate deacetylase DoeB2 [Myxococcales bacterium]|nr:N(2)-acetyl-L-2,4-diaminobutanoate deacetylase DoeB2 [Myxococcales bacterium]